MNILSPSNQKLVGPDDLPLDWHNDVKFWGLSRNVALKCYVIRLAVAGVQHSLGVAYSQESAARLYDLALWKFAPKMARDGHINFPDDFVFITQEVIDRDAPRLNELFLKIPFLKLSDESVPEPELRERRLVNGFAAVPKDATGVKDFYLTQLGRLKRLRVAIAAAFVSVSEGHTKLGLQKLPELSTKFHTLEQTLAALSKNLLDLEATMESQHAYYRKMKYDSENV